MNVEAEIRSLGTKPSKRSGTKHLPKTASTSATAPTSRDDRWCKPFNSPQFTYHLHPIPPLATAPPVGDVKTKFVEREGEEGEGASKRSLDETRRRCTDTYRIDRVYQKIVLYCAPATLAVSYATGMLYGRGEWQLANGKAGGKPGGVEGGD